MLKRRLRPRLFGIWVTACVRHRSTPRYLATDSDTPSLLKSVILRRARLEDYQSIIAIGDKYGGRDYFTSHFHGYLANKRCYPLVAELRGKAVGFHLSQQLDGGQAVMKRAARVHRDYPQLDVLQLMDRELDRYARKELSSARYEMFSVFNRAYERDRVDYLKVGYTDLLTKPIRCLHFNAKDFRNVKRPSQLNSVIPMTYNDLKHLFQHDRAIENLFPRKMLYNFMQGFRPLEVNIPLVWSNGKLAYATTTESIPQTSRPNTPDGDNLTRQMIERIDMVSFSLNYLAKIGLVYFIDIYAVNGFRSVSLKDHIQRHLNTVAKLTSGTGVLWLTLTANVDVERTAHCLMDYGVGHFLPTAEGSIHLLKRDIDRSGVT
ncbi:unnamed protein product [Lymnaea stagnalis]|uniref:N-acetyltransferase domain-containing protein n=1 Tax=Lymnaea stagnalis TaxID=6523 RepID=A0AAV2HN00_LYMST